MKLRRIGIILSLASFWILSAQKIDEKSKLILDAISENYHSKRNIAFEFTYSLFDQGNVLKKESGSLYLSGKRHRLRVMGIDQIFDGQRLYNINDNEKEVTIAKDEKDRFSFSSLIDPNTYQKLYDISYVENKDKAKGNLLDLVKLVPVDSEKSEYTHMFLYVNSKEKRLTKSEQYFSNGMSEVITVDKYSENQGLDPSFFSFEKKHYGDYLITEL